MTSTMTSPTTRTSRVSAPSGPGTHGEAEAATAISAASAALRRMMRMFAVEADALALAMEEVEQERRHVLARDAGRCSGGQAGGEQPLVQCGIHLLVLGQRVGHDQAASGRPQRFAGVHHGGDLGRRVDPPLDAMPRVPQVEAGEGMGAEAEHGDAQGLQPFQGCAHVEDRLHPGADDGDRQGGQREQVGRLVPRVAGIAVHAAEAAGREHVDAYLCGQMGRRRDSCRAMAGARCHGRQVARTHLDDLVAAGDLRQRVVVQPDARGTRHERDRRRDRAGGPHGVLDLACDAQVVGARQAVADDRRLERDDRPAGRQRVGDLWMHRDHEGRR